MYMWDPRAAPFNFEDSVGGLRVRHRRREARGQRVVDHQRLCEAWTLLAEVV